MEKNMRAIPLGLIVKWTLCASICLLLWACLDVSDEHGVGGSVWREEHCLDVDDVLCESWYWVFTDDQYVFRTKDPLNILSCEIYRYKIEPGSTGDWISYGMTYGAGSFEDQVTLKLFNAFNPACVDIERRKRPNCWPRDFLYFFRLDLSEADAPDSSSESDGSSGYYTIQASRTTDLDMGDCYPDCSDPVCYPLLSSEACDDDLQCPGGECKGERCSYEYTCADMFHCTSEMLIGGLESEDERWLLPMFDMNAYLKSFLVQDCESCRYDCPYRYDDSGSSGSYDERDPACLAACPCGGVCSQDTCTDLGQLRNREETISRKLKDHMKRNKLHLVSALPNGEELYDRVREECGYLWEKSFKVTEFDAMDLSRLVCCDGSCISDAQPYVNGSMVAPTECAHPESFGSCVSACDSLSCIEFCYEEFCVAAADGDVD